MSGKFVKVIMNEFQINLNWFDLIKFTPYGEDEGGGGFSYIVSNLKVEGEKGSK